MGGSLDSVLVIGGCGGLGHHIVKQLLENHGNTTVTVFDLRIDYNRTSGAEYIQGNLCRREDVLSALQKARPRVVFHTVSPQNMVNKNSRQILHDVNITGTGLLLDCVKEVQATKALIYTSSSSVVHDNTTDLVEVTEALPLCYEGNGQKEYYTHTKAVAEDLVKKANAQDGLLTATIRANTLFGEGDTTMTPQMVNNARAGRGKFQVGDGTNLFDFTYIGNAAEAHILAAEALLRESAMNQPIPEDTKVNGEAFVITNDDHWPFWDFARAVGARAGHPVKREEVWVIPVSVYYACAVIAEWATWLASLGRKEAYINRRVVKFLTMTRTFNISKAKQRLGYRPQVDMHEGINRAVDFYVARFPEEKAAK